MTSRALTEAVLRVHDNQHGGRDALQRAERVASVSSTHGEAAERQAMQAEMAQDSDSDDLPHQQLFVNIRTFMDLAPPTVKCG